jgi:hypothetical protein
MQRKVCEIGHSHSATISPVAVYRPDHLYDLELEQLRQVEVRGEPRP